MPHKIDTHLKLLRISIKLNNILKVSLIFNVEIDRKFKSCSKEMYNTTNLERKTVYKTHLNCTLPAVYF